MGLTIVLGYDGSDCARAALARSADLLREAGGGKVVVVVAYPMSAAYVPTAGVAGAPMMMGAELQDHIDMLQQTAQQQAEEAAEELHGKGIEVETEVTAEPAAQALLDAAGRHAADLIAVGTHGEGAISGALLGSTSYRLVHRSRLPLLIVPLRD
jgi:nucleotide-binding universal stress UspA family protein